MNLTFLEVYISMKSLLIFIINAIICLWITDSDYIGIFGKQDIHSCEAVYFSSWNFHSWERLEMTFCKAITAFHLVQTAFPPQKSIHPCVSKMTLWLCYWCCAFATFSQLLISTVKYHFVFMLSVWLHCFRWVGSMHFSVSSSSSEHFT